MMKRLLIVFCFVFAWLVEVKAQCPQIYNSAGTLTSNPVFVYCSSGSYALNLQSNTAWGAYTISWGDASSNTTGTSNAANNIITHVYAAAVNTFVITLTIPSASCTRTMLVVMEQPSGAGVSIFGANGYICAPGTVTVTNNSTNASPTTTYTYAWGDGVVEVLGPSNVNQTKTHYYAAGTAGNCGKTMTLTAANYCKPLGSDGTVNVDIYDVENNIAIAVDAVTKCLPENSFTFANGTTSLNCFPQGNNGQRYERWNLGNNWGTGSDSILGWRPFPPYTPFSITYPAVVSSHTVLLVDSNKCGLKSTVITVNIVPPPTASLIAPSGNICQNTSVTFTNTSATGYSYKWNFGTGGGFVNLGSGNKSNTYTTPGTYTVKVVAFVNGSNSACSDTASAVINVLAAPVANFSYTPTTGCSSIAAVSFTDSSTGAVSWNWNFGNGNTFVGQNPPNQTYTAAGVTTISLLVTGSTTCVHTRTASVTVYSTPVPSFPVFANCLGAVSNFSNTSTVTGTAAINSYTWNFGDGSLASNASNPVHTYTAINTYSVKLIVATAFCKDSITQNILINVKPTANFVFTPTIACPPFASTFSNTTLNGINYLWRFGTAPTATSNLANPSFTYNNTTQNLQTYSVTLISSTGVGCADSIKKLISVYPKPVASFSTNAIAGCSPATFNFTNTTLGASSYSWAFGDSGVSTQTNASHTYTNNSLLFQTRIVQLIVQNSNGCLDTTTQSLQIYPVPFFTFTMTPGAGCTPLLVNFQSVPGIISYTWDYGDGALLSNANTNITHTYYNTTNSDLTHTVTLIASNAFGCIDTTYGYPVIYPKPVVNFSLSPTVGCSPLTVNFSNNSIGNTTNQWTFGNGQTSAQTNPSTTYTNAVGALSTNFVAKLVATTVHGCKDSITSQVKLFDHPQSIFTVDTPACSPKDIHFFSNSNHGSSYQWTFGDNNNAPILDINTDHLYINNTAFNQIYTSMLVTTSNDGCKDTLKVPIVVHPKPIFFITSLPDSGCTPLNVLFRKIVGVSVYQWNFGDGNMASTDSVHNLFVNNTSGDKIFRITLVASDVYGCADTVQKSVKVYPKPTADFTAEPTTVYIPNQATQTYNHSTQNCVYAWDFGDGGTSAEFSPSHKYTQKGDYEIGLVVTNSRGCSDTAATKTKISAKDETSIKVPNAFTPNPNGPANSMYDPLATNNDVFHPVLTGAKEYEFSIFSRWGELLFDTRDSDEGWDGYYKGKLCTQDVYIWKISAKFVDGKTYNKTGDVLLLR